MAPANWKESFCQGKDWDKWTRNGTQAKQGDGSLHRGPGWKPDEFESSQGAFSPQLGIHLYMIGQKHPWQVQEKEGE